MASRGTIRDLFDVENMQGQLGTVISLADKYTAAVEKANKVKIGLKSATKPSEMIAGIEAVTTSHKKQIEVITALDKAKQRLAASTSKEAKELAFINAQIGENNRQVALNAKAQNVVAGSLEAAAVKVAKLRYELLILGDVEGKNAVKAGELRTAIDVQNKFIDRNSDALARQKINIGNYGGALSVIGKSLKGFGALGNRLADVLGIDPAIAMGVQEAGRAVGNLKAALAAQKLAQQGATEATVVGDVATKSATVSQRIYALVVGTSTGAMKAFRIAAALMGVGLIILGVLALAGAFSKVSAAASDFAKNQKRINEVNKQAIDGYVEQISSVKEYVKQIKDASTTDGERIKILKEVNEKWGDQIGVLTDVNQLETVFVAKSESLISSLILRAKAQAAYALAVEATKKSLLAQMKLQDIDMMDTKGIGVMDLRKKAMNAEAVKEIKTAKADAENLFAMFGDLQKQARIVETKGGINFGKAVKDPKKDKEGRDLAEADLKATFEIEKTRLQIIIDTNNKIASDNESHITEKLAAATLAYAAEQELIIKQGNFEKSEGDKTAKEKEKIDSDVHYNLLSAEGKYQENILKINDDWNKKRLEADKKWQEMTDKMNDDELKKYLEDIEKKTKAEKDHLDEIRKMNNQAEKDREKLADKTAELQKELLNEIQELTFSLLASGIDRQKNAIQEEIDLLEEKKQKDIEVANQTIANVQDRAAAITVIESRANAQKEALEKRQRELDFKKATFEKAQAIAKIIQSVAVAIAGQLLTPWQIALTVAIGAAQLAAVIAQPIQKYRTGTKNHPGGPAIVGEGTTSELVDIPGKGMFIADRPTLIHDLPKGSRVHPDLNKVIMNEQIRRTLGIMGGRAGEGGNGNTDVVQGLAAVERAIGKIPQANITVSNPLKQRIRYGSSINEHITRSLGR